MKLKLILLSALVLLSAQVSAKDVQPESDKDRLSYSVGVYTAKNFKKEGMSIDSDWVLKGITDVMAGEKLKLSDKEISGIMNNLASELRRNGIANRREAAEKNLKTGAAFLAANKLKEGVVTLPSGVQYQVLKAGSGKKPADSEMVVCNYRGTLIDGTEFDATDEGKPSTIKVSALVTGWREAVKLMPAGSKWRIFIPSAQAYAERGVGTVIGPNETLIFELELLAVK